MFTICTRAPFLLVYVVGEFGVVDSEGVLIASECIVACSAHKIILIYELIIFFSGVTLVLTMTNPVPGCKKCAWNCTSQLIIRWNFYKVEPLHPFMGLTCLFIERGAPGRGERSMWGGRARPGGRPRPNGGAALPPSGPMYFISVSAQMSG